MPLMVLGLLGWASLFGQTMETKALLASLPGIDSSYVLKKSISFQDSLGSHFLVLLKSQRLSKDGVETIVLKAAQYRQEGASWLGEWEIRDRVECEGLDIAGDFDANLAEITDLDSNGIMETTMAYQLVCAGGVEPRTTKVIMRQGKMKYSVRGESLVKIGKDVSYGGLYSVDSVLNQKPAFKHFLVEKWKRIADY